jgi:hypothetical protein|tara:strand:+ start:805 stop:2262 length:1458 start_codon:yes stop_codon:yes gene_type:complete
MAFDNFTVNVVSFNETEGVDWTQSRPSVTLTITPNAGYAIDVANFSPINPLPTYVNSVTFSQSGANIECTILYITPSIMPSADVLVALCISGVANPIAISVTGSVIDCGISNVLQPAAGDLPLAYNGSGVTGSNSTVITQTVAADTGYYFESAPVLSLSIGNLSNYTITNVKTYNASNQLIQVVFTVTYTFPAISVAGDKFCLTANAFEIYSPSAKILSYSFNTGSVSSAVTTTRLFTINGIEGANWALNASYTPGNVTIVNTSGTIDSTGLAVIAIIFPTSTANRLYTFTLTGDLAPSFDTTGGQLSVFTIYQYINTSLSFGFTSSNTDITVGAADSRSFIPYGSTLPIYVYNVTATSVSNITLASLPLAAWTNQSLLAPFYDQSVLSSAVTIDNTQSVKTIAAQIEVGVNFLGTSDLLSTLNLDNYITGTLVPISLYFGATAQDACCTGILGNYFVASGETFSSAVAVLLADGTPAPDGFYKQ